MPVNPTYPGIYIEEIPSNARTITPAPTSIAAFVGYTNPFQTKPGNFGKAVLIFSFSDFEREFGGLFVSGSIPADLPHAVSAFFLNGGSLAYIAALKPRNHFSGAPSEDIKPATADITTTGGGVRFTASEPVDRLPMRVSIQPKIGADTLAEITLSYGTRTETYRDVELGPAPKVEEAFKGSQLAKVSPFPAGYGTKWGTAVTVVFNDPPLGAGYTGVFSAADFVGAFGSDRALDKVDIFNLLLMPGVTDTTVLSAALSFAERKRAFLIMDPKPQLAADSSSSPLPTMEDDFKGPTVPKGKNGAIFYPPLKALHPLTGDAIEIAPSGYVAGIFARTDTNRGVWKAPAGLETTVLDTTGVVARGRMTDLRQGELNKAGVNCLRTFPLVGTVVFGARTLVSANTAFGEWKYVPVRRVALFIEQTLERELKWVIFEPNDEPLWVAITISVTNFMTSLFNQHAFQGTKPSQAFLVKCDSTTTTQDDINKGIVNIIVGFAPLKPAEFVIVKITQLAGQVQA